MTKYCVTWETDYHDGDYFSTYDEEEAERAFQDIIDQTRTTWAILQEFYVFGGMCQGSKITRHYKR